MNIDYLFNSIVFVFLPAVFFLILGICIFVKYSKKQPYEYYRNKYLPYILSAIPMYIGLFIIIKHFFNERAIAFMIFPIFIIGIIYMLVKIITEMFKSISKKYKEVEGIVVTYSTDSNSDSESSQTFNRFETIEYNVDGKTYYYTDSMSATWGSKVGKKRILKYNPSNPSDCVIKGRYIIKTIFLIVFGFLLYILMRLVISTI